MNMMIVDIMHTQSQRTTLLGSRYRNLRAGRRGAGTGRLETMSPAADEAEDDVRLEPLLELEEDDDE